MNAELVEKVAKEIIRCVQCNRFRSLEGSKYSYYEGANSIGEYEMTEEWVCKLCLAKTEVGE